MKSRTILYVVLAVVVLLVAWLWTGYNGLITAKTGVANAWSQVETDYQRRMDLIPNVVNTVKGSAQFEQSTLLAVTKARTDWLSANSISDKVTAAQNFDSSLSRLLVSVEAYPQLSSTQSFRDLTTELEGTENRIAVARRDFNDAVGGYNIKISRFPTNILAHLFGFAPEKFFQAQPGSENAPKVDFGS